MSEKFFVLTVPSGSWSSATDIGFRARTVVLLNRSSVPVEIRPAASGDAVVRLAASGDVGSARVLTYQRNTAPILLAAFGIGGTGEVWVEASQEERSAAIVPAAISGATSALSNATPLVDTAAGSAGVATLGSRADHAHPLPFDDAVPPAPLEANAASGNDLFAARRDHVHVLPTDDTLPSPLGDAVAGVAIRLSRNDHVHPLPVGATAAAPLGAVASAGVSTVLSRDDHVHARPTVDTTYSAVFDDLGIPDAPSADAAHALFAGNDPGNSFPGPFTPNAEHRSYSVSFQTGWDAGNVTLASIDPFGDPVSEVFVANPGNTVQGTKIFAGGAPVNATKGAVGASADGASIGRGNSLGLYRRLQFDGGGVLLKGGVPTTAEFLVDFHRVNPSSAPNGVDRFVVCYVAQHTHTLS